MREKDGLWAVLLWLNILAARKQSVDARSCASTGPTYGRNYYSRHDYEEVDSRRRQRADGGPARARCRRCPASSFGDARRSPRPTTSPTTTRSTARVSANQGIRILFEDGSRIVFRLSGTGTAGATLRVYIERFEPDPARHGVETQDALADLIAVAGELAGIRRRTGRDAAGRDHLSEPDFARLLTPGAARAARRRRSADGGVNVAVWSRAPSASELCLFDARRDAETERIALARAHRRCLPRPRRRRRRRARYGLRADGPYAPERGHWFDPAKLLVDPYATRARPALRLHPASSAIAARRAPTDRDTSTARP